MKASKKNGTVYVGMTDDIKVRNLEHKLKKYEGFTARHGVDNLVYYTQVPDFDSAISLEKKLKGITRKKKISIIEENNPEWSDLTYSI
ncbi:MAG: GIY-YIG nuclease family protein [Ignavibacteria bacterium]